MHLKPWTWTCHMCGHDDNRNHHRNCVMCNAQIRCEQAGGHHWGPNDSHCSNGCGRRRDTSGTDLNMRRKDY